MDATLTEAYGAISGTVTGSDGPALPGIEVTVYTSADALKGTTTTDASGNYSVGNLPSGTYKVHFGGNYDYFAEYYLDKTSLATATLVPVTIPDATDVDAVLIKNFGSICGTVTDEASGNPISGCQVVVYDLSWNQITQTVTDASGVYSTAPIHSGSYKVYFNPTDGIHRYEYYNNQLTSSTANTVTVVGGQDTLNINGVLSNKARIAGTCDRT